jgi:hypothetical protein
MQPIRNPFQLLSGTSHTSQVGGMNWDANSAVSEVVGVVTALLYLVRETRNGAEAMDATSSREAFHQISDRRLDVARTFRSTGYRRLAMLYAECLKITQYRHRRLRPSFPRPMQLKRTDTEIYRLEISR